MESAEESATSADVISVTTYLYHVNSTKIESSVYTVVP